MRKLRTFIRAALAAALRPEETAPDPLASFNPRDWADLPVYHPARDREPGGSCRT